MDRLAYPAAYIALSTAFCWPLFAQPLADGSGDWDQHLFYYASVLRNAAFGDLPFWNPWYCGGNVLWQNAQASVISPVYVLALIMPLALAMKLNILAHYVAGCFGMHLVVRRMIGVRSPTLVLYLVSLFVFSGGLALRLSAGQSNFLSVFWLPALVYCFWQAAAGQTRSLLLGAAIVGVSILNGGPHVVSLAAMLLVCIGLGAILYGRTLRALIVGVAIVVLGCVYAAPKLVPGAFFVASADFHDRRPTKHPDSMSVEMIGHALFDASQGTSTRFDRTVQLYGWHEYGSYMGWFGAALAFAAAGWILVFRRGREHWREATVAISAFVFLLLAAGEFAPLAPASLLRRLPFFSSFRIPSRHILLIPLAGSICLAFAARSLESVRRVATSRLLELVCIVGICQLLIVNREHLRDVFLLPPDAAATRLFERQTPANAEHDVPRVGGPERVLSTNMLGSMFAGVSPLDCYEPLQLKKVARPGPANIQAEGDITFSGSHFSPNRVAATVAIGSEPARVVLNQNFSDGWSTSVGQIERDPGSGRPSAVLPAGYTGEVVFTFFPPGLWLGLMVWVPALVVSIFAWRRAGAREHQR